MAAASPEHTTRLQRRAVRVMALWKRQTPKTTCHAPGLVDVQHQAGHVFVLMGVFTAAFGALTLVLPTPATHAILAQLKAGECIRHSI